MTKPELNTGLFDIFSLCRLSRAGIVLLVTTLFFLKCLWKSDRCIIETTSSGSVIIPSHDIGARCDVKSWSVWFFPVAHQLSVLPSAISFSLYSLLFFPTLRGSLHCLKALWCFNQWINDCFYFHPSCVSSTRAPLPPWKGLRWNLGKKGRGKNVWRWHCKVSVSTWMYLHTFQWSSRLIAPGSTSPCCHFGFITRFFIFSTNVMFTSYLNRSARLITLCKPCPINVMFTAVVLLGIKDKVMFDLAWAKSPHARTKPLPGDRKLVYLRRDEELAKTWISALHRSTKFDATPSWLQS